MTGGADTPSPRDATPSPGGTEFKSVSGLILECLESPGRRPCQPRLRHQSTIRTAWECLVPLANGLEPTRTRAHGRVNRDKLAEIDLHWHDLRHEAACRWLAKGLDLRAIQVLLGHADLKTTQRYLNVTDEELKAPLPASQLVQESVGVSGGSRPRQLTATASFNSIGEPS